MKIILNYIQKTSVIFYVLYSTLIVSGLELIFFSLGFLLAIPTDYGRIFAFSATAFTLTFHIYSIICFVFIKPLLILRNYRHLSFKFRLLKKKRVANQKKEFNIAILKALKFCMDSDEINNASIILNDNDADICQVLKAYFLNSSVRKEFNSITNQFK